MDEIPATGVSGKDGGSPFASPVKWWIRGHIKTKKTGEIRLFMIVDIFFTSHDLLFLS